MTFESKEQFLVTGAAGFVGQWLVRHLVASGVSVRAMVRSDDQAELVRALGAQPVFADLLDPGSLDRAVQQVSGVYHIAALFRQSSHSEDRFNQINAEGTRLLLDSCIRAGVPRFVHCSTVGVLGHVENPPADENTPYAPGDPYQRSKMEGEKVALDYFRRGSIGGVVIRPAMIYGPGDRRTLKLFRMIAQRRFFYVGSGDALVQFIDVRDRAIAFHLAMEKREINAEVFIIAGQRALSLKSLVHLISHTLDIKPPWLHLPVKPMQLLGSLCEAICRPIKIEPPIFRRRVDFYTKSRSFDFSKAQRMLGFLPSKQVEEEVWEILDWYHKEGWISRKPMPNPSLMVRSQDGRISFWNRAAEDRYGWSKPQAVGQISHSLLRTRFPDDLRKINSTLADSGIWKGILLHTRRDGSEVRVASLWQLVVDRKGERRVVELNVDCTDHSESGNRHGALSAPTVMMLSEMQAWLSEVMQIGGALSSVL
jgi:PAS domain S-box-containing protein